MAIIFSKCPICNKEVLSFQKYVYWNKSWYHESCMIYLNHMISQEEI